MGENFVDKDVRAAIGVSQGRFDLTSEAVVAQHADKIPPDIGVKRENETQCCASLGLDLSSEEFGERATTSSWVGPRNGQVR
jgi:hypothetical protein